MAIKKLSDLQVEASKEAFEFELSKGNVITFASPEDLPFEKANAFLGMIEGDGTSLIDIFTNWLSEEDYAKLSEANLTLKQITALLQLVQEHYEAIFSTAPKESA
jgi:hypothetical protein